MSPPTPAGLPACPRHDGLLLGASVQAGSLARAIHAASNDPRSPKKDRSRRGQPATSTPVPSASPAARSSPPSEVVIALAPAGEASKQALAAGAGGELGINMDGSCEEVTAAGGVAAGGAGAAVLPAAAVSSSAAASAAADAFAEYSDQDALIWCMELALALQFLHAQMPPIVHRWGANHRACSLESANSASCGYKNARSGGHPT